MQIVLVAGAIGAAVLIGTCAAAAGRPKTVVHASAAADERRVSRIVGRGLRTADPQGWIWAAQSVFASGGIGLADVQALKRDRRRAHAAYPDVSSDDMFEGRWLGFKPNSVPESYGGGNAEATQGPDGKFYLDSAYLSVVRAQYTKRATDAETEAFYIAKGAKERAAELARLEKDGAFMAMGGSGGSFSYNCKVGGNCVVNYAAEWSSDGKRWTFPFVPTEWVGNSPWDIDGLKKIASFALATVERVKVAPTGVSMSMGSMGSPVGTLLPGESATAAISTSIPR